MLYLPKINDTRIYLLILILQFSQASFAEYINRDIGIAIDIGHSPKHKGAISARGVGEYYFNQTIAQLLLKRLLQQGFNNSFIISRYNPEMPLHSRASFANAKKADLLISIHHDSVQKHYLKPWVYQEKNQLYSDKFKGFSIFISNDNPQTKQSLLFAELLGTELLDLEFSPSIHHHEAIKGENRPLLLAKKGIYQYDQLIILKRSKMPAVLLECGVIVNPAEEKKLLQKNYQYLLVNALERAIVRFAALLK